MMCKKIIAAVLALSALTLGGCSFNSAEENESVSEIVSAAAVAAVSQRAEAGSTSAVTTSVTSETVIFCDESVFSETTETEPSYIEDGKPPVVMSAEELYETYPVKIIYPERQDVSDKVKTEVMREELYTSDGLRAAEFSAEYPVISGYDEAVCKKINDEITAYVYGEYERTKAYTESYDYDDNEIMCINDYGTLINEWAIRINGIEFDGFGYDINGNIFTVYFSRYWYQFQAVHGSEKPEPMMFDLRTGDKINFSELIGDKDKMHEAFAEAEWYGELMCGAVACGKVDADGMVEALKDDKYINNILKSNSLYSYDRIMVIDGCIGFLLAPYENGCYADGVRFRRLPASEFIPYMNEKGKALFEGYVSAETTAPNVIEYKGKRWFDNVEWIPEFVDRKNLTEYDREFILMFENARNAEYYLNYE